MGAFLGCLKKARNREESASFCYDKNKKKLEKDKIKNQAKKNEKGAFRIKMAEKIIMLGNDADKVEKELSKYAEGYKTKNFKVVERTRKDMNTTTAEYEVFGVGVSTIYNECAETIIEDIPSQARCNIGIEIKTGNSQLYKQVKNKLENIVGIKIKPGAKTAKMAREGMR